MFRKLCSCGLTVTVSIDIDIHFAEGTLMILKIVHLCLKEVRSYNLWSTSAFDYLVGCEKFTVRRGCPEMVSVDTEMHRSGS